MDHNHNRRPTRVCITGSNAGVGYEAARQMSLQEGVKTVILACRNPTKAQEAKDSLEKATNKLNCFEILIMDMSDLASIQKAVDTLQEPIDCLILNAGGFVGKPPTQMSDDANKGTMKIFDLNVLGGVHLTDLLLEQNKLVSGSHVLYVSSETSRGIKGLNTLHQFTNNGSVEEIKKICNGTYFQQSKSPRKELDVYGRVKLIGNLWAGYMARQYPHMRFVAVSPGNTSGTNVVHNMNMPKFFRWLAYKLALPLMAKCGRYHPLEVGAKRYLDVIYDNDNAYKAGHFYASASSWPTGPMTDQIEFAPDFLYEESYQNNANTAIHSFIKQQ